MGLLSKLGLGLDQPIPPEALQDVLPPPPGLPLLHPPRLRWDLLGSGVTFILIGWLGSALYAGGYKTWWSVTGSVIGYGLGIFFIGLAVAHRNVQSRAINNGVQTVATVTKFLHTSGINYGRNSRNRWDKFTLDAQWTGNDDSTYYFRSINYYSNSVILPPEAKVGEPVRLYIDRSNTRLYYLDDITIPDLAIQEQMDAAIQKTWVWAGIALAIVFIGVPLVLFIFAMFVAYI